MTGGENRTIPTRDRTFYMALAWDCGGGSLKLKDSDGKIIQQKSLHGGKKAKKSGSEGAAPRSERFALRLVESDQRRA